jgi:hypothetical protein
MSGLSLYQPYTRKTGAARNQDGAAIPYFGGGGIADYYSSADYTLDKKDRDKPKITLPRLEWMEKISEKYGNGNT